MSRKLLLLLAGCVLALPGTGFAKSADALDFAPTFAPVANAKAMITRSESSVPPQPIVWGRPDQQSERPVAVIMPLALEPVTLPAAFGAVITVSMTSVSAPGGVCREMMTVTPASNGRVVIHVERQGGGCAVTPTMMAPSRSGPAQPAQGHGVNEAGKHFVPGNALPPPSKLTYAGYEAPQSGPHATRE